MESAVQKLVDNIQALVFFPQLSCRGHVAIQVLYETGFCLEAHPSYLIYA